MNKEEYKANKLEELHREFPSVWDGKVVQEFLTSFLSQTIDELWNNGKADMIVDLYQIRESLNRQDINKYHFLTAMVAKLCDINDIREKDIEEAIGRRAEAERMRGLNNN